MERSTFFSRLLVVTVLNAALLAGLHFGLPVFQKHWPVSIAALATFVGICLALFFVGERMATSKNRLAFNHLITFSVLGKILVSLVVLFVYFKMKQPTDRLFIVPFLLTYLVFTVFETWFMMKLARLKPAGR